MRVLCNVWSLNLHMHRNSCLLYNISCVNYGRLHICSFCSTPTPFAGWPCHALSAGILQFAWAHGVNILCLPPHITHKMQPLNCGVFAPLKLHSSSGCHDFLHQNPGNTQTLPPTSHHFKSTHGRRNRLCMSTPSNTWPQIWTHCSTKLHTWLGEQIYCYCYFVWTQCHEYP